MIRRASGHERLHPPLSSRSTLAIAIAAILYGGLHPSPASAEVAADSLEEVIVTARKRAENLQDVPQNVDAFTSQDLQKLGIGSIEDFALLSPSISLTGLGPGMQRFFIRGASDGSNAEFGDSAVSTTGYLMDDLSLSFYGHIPDLHLYDIERIEVLNGPQGTLFGAGAMSGAVRIISKKPDADAFSAGADIDVGQIDGGGVNRSYEGYVNLPLIEGRTALRLSAFDLHQGGYIDNLYGTRNWLNGTTSNNAPWAGNNFNTRHESGARLALQENFTDDWRLTLTGFYQRQVYDGLWEEEPLLHGPLNTEIFSPQGGNEFNRFFEARLEGDVGIADLIYIGGYSDVQRVHLYDFSDYAQYSSYASFVQGITCKTSPGFGGSTYSGCNVPWAFAHVQAEVSRFSNEVRLQSKAGGRFHWTVGGYWEKTEDPYQAIIHLPGINFSGAQAQYIINAYQNTATPKAGVYYEDEAKFDYLQTTEFADLTYDLDRHWSLEAGVVHFHGSTSELTTVEQYFYEAAMPVTRTSSYDKTSFKAAVNFKATEHALLYFSFAQGFRDGGFNYDQGNGKYPTQFNPDSLDSYELGFKSAWLDNRLVWNNALYYMPWKDYQVGVTVMGPPFGFHTNIGNVRIYGLESSIEVQPLSGLLLAFSGNYNDSKLLTDDYVSATYQVIPGERLPEAPYFNYSALARYERPVTHAFNGFLQFDVGHKGDMYNNLEENVRTLQAAYTIGGLHFGVDDPGGRWELQGYITNLWNTRAVAYQDYNSYVPEDVPTEPRIFGLHLKYRWGKTP